MIINDIDSRLVPNELSEKHGISQSAHMKINIVI